MRYIALSDTGGLLDDRGSTIAVIEDLCLAQVRFRALAEPLIGADVPIPLYWRQYAGHQDPERRASDRGTIRIVEQEETRLELLIESCTPSGAARSESRLTVDRNPADGRIRYTVDTILRIAEGLRWSVAPNPHHGEIDFATVWPLGVFPPDNAQAKRYAGCAVLRRGEVMLLRHHHFESADKHNITMREGDRFFWIGETDNPCVEILGGTDACAGLCAYMWDAHFGIRVGGARPITLEGGSAFHAAYRLSSLSADEAERLVAAARHTPPEAPADIPIAIDGEQSFSETLPEDPAALRNVWPWQTELLDGNAEDVELAVDRTIGCGDSASLRITHRGPARSRWLATTFGPAFGGAPFVPGMSFAVRVMVRAERATGDVTIALRIHREQEPGLFDPGSYEMHATTRPCDALGTWCAMDVRTRPDDRAADRVHIVLEFAGTGTCRFDDVAFVRIPASGRTEAS